MFFQEDNEESLTNYFFQKQKYTYSAEWIGKLIKPLGISNDYGIDVPDYDALENNRHPRTGKPLIAKNSSGKQRSGSNFLIFPPQSMSILIVTNMTWNQEIANILMEIFLRSVRKLLNFIELGHAQARIRTEKERKIVKTKALLFATFTHLFQSQMSPFVHVHVRLFQPTLINGKLFTLRNDLIKRSSKLYGLLLRADLMHQLQEIGLDTIVRDARHGFFEIEGLENVAKSFPSRSDEIESYKSEYVQQYPELSASFIKKIAIRKNRQNNNDETDVKKILTTIISKLEANGFSKEYFEHFWNTRQIKKRQFIKTEKLLYLGYLQYGDTLFTYSKEAIMKIMALQSIKINQGLMIEDLVATLQSDNFAEHIRKIITIEIEKQNQGVNYESDTINRPRIVNNYAQGTLSRARRVSESARIANRNVKQNYQLIDDTNLWSIVETISRVQLEQIGIDRTAPRVDPSPETVNSFTFDDLDQPNVDYEIHNIKP